MIRIRIGVVLLSAMLLGAAYQEKAKNEDPPVKIKGVLPPHYKKVGLTDQQVQKIYKIRNDYRIKIDNLKKEMERLKDEEKEATEKVLTPIQLKRLRELRGG